VAHAVYDEECNVIMVVYCVLIYDECVRAYFDEINV